jgi:hypothetical protein
MPFIVALIALPAGMLIGSAMANARARGEYRRRVALERTRTAISRIQKV